MLTTFRCKLNAIKFSCYPSPAFLWEFILETFLSKSKLDSLLDNCVSSDLEQSHIVSDFYQAGGSVLP